MDRRCAPGSSDSLTGSCRAQWAGSAVLVVPWLPAGTAANDGAPFAPATASTGLLAGVCGRLPPARWQTHPSRGRNTRGCSATCLRGLRLPRHLNFRPESARTRPTELPRKAVSAQRGYIPKVDTAPQRRIIVCSECWTYDIGDNGARPAPPRTPPSRAGAARGSPPIKYNAIEKLYPRQTWIQGDFSATS